MSSEAQFATDGGPHAGNAQGRSVIAFVCTNGAREGRVPSPIRTRPPASPFDWPLIAQEIPVPCSGRIQPEHLLKAFESGADLVCVVGCQHGNCHSLEGSDRAQRRLQYVQKILDEIGLDGARLMWFSLPGSAREDMAAAIGQQLAAADCASIAADIARQVKDRLRSVAPNRLAEKA